MADLALGVVKDIVKTGMAIKEAVDTVRQNEEECQELRVRVATITDILSPLQEMELTRHPGIRHPAMFGALRGLNGSLDRALKLVTECQKRKAMHRLLTAGDMAKQLRRVKKDIQADVLVGNLAISVSIMFTFEYTRTAVRLGGAQPQQAAAEMDIYGSHSTTGGLTKFTLSETLRISKENIDGGSRYTIAGMLKIVIKVQMTCEKCRSKAMSMTATVDGVHSIRIGGDGRDQLEVVGDNLDAVKLVSLLRKKVGPAALLDEYMTTVVNAEEAQQEPASRWPRTRINGGIRDITAKLSRFMRPCPRSSTTSQAAPSSSPQLLEYTDTPVPAPTTGPWPHLFPGESSSSMTFSAATPPAGIHQYQEHARTSARRAKAGDLFEKPDLLLPQHQPAAPPATAPVRHMRRTFNMSKIHRSVRLPAVRQSRMMPRAKKIETSSFERSGARVLLPLMSCALCALVLLASVWALR